MIVIEVAPMPNRVSIAIRCDNCLTVIELNPEAAQRHAVDVLTAVVLAQQPPCPTLAKLMEVL